MNAVVYDAGILIAADRNDRAVWLSHRVRLESGVLPLVPTAVVAQVSRTPRQASLRRMLSGCETVALLEKDAHRVGAILARSRSNDVVDAAVVEVAIRRKADVVTADSDDIAQLLSAARVRRRAHRV